jgi:hypothetical protein
VVTEEIDNNEKLRHLIDDSDDDETSSKPFDRVVRKAKHDMRMQMETMTETRKEFKECLKKFENEFSELEEAHIWAQTIDGLIDTIKGISVLLSRM